MKTLTNYISEKLIINKNLKNTSDYFIYKLDDYCEIAIFDDGFPELNYYSKKVYVNGKNNKIDWEGYTKERYEPGEYKVEIKDIDDITDCCCMFFCSDIKIVPWFDTSKVVDMSSMFQGCENLKEVPLFDTSKVTDMKNMFKGCYNLSDKTKELWSTIYDFEEDDKRK